MYLEVFMNNEENMISQLSPEERLKLRRTLEQLREQGEEEVKHWSAVAQQEQLEENQFLAEAQKLKQNAPPAAPETESTSSIQTEQKAESESLIIRVIKFLFGLSGHKEDKSDMQKKIFAESEQGLIEMEHDASIFSAEKYAEGSYKNFLISNINTDLSKKQVLECQQALDQLDAVERNLNQNDSDHFALESPTNSSTHMSTLERIDTSSLNKQSSTSSAKEEKEFSLEQPVSPK
jgi:hypothetical protein